jgi:hypothetical protein
VCAGQLDKSSGNIVPIPNSPILCLTDQEEDRFTPEAFVPFSILGNLPVGTPQ